MPDPKPVQIGKPLEEFPGQSFNALVRKYFADAAAIANGPQIGVGNQPFLAALVHNTMSEVIEPGSILGYSEPLATMEENRFQVYTGAALKGVTPAVPKHSSQFAVAIESIAKDSGVGLAAFMGLIYVKVNWTDDSHTKVKVAEGETLLQSGTSGLTPVWHEEIPEDLPAELWALVLLGGGGGSSPDVSIHLGRVLDPGIPPATSNRFEFWGSGHVSRLDDETGEDLETETLIYNPWPVTFAEDALVEIGVIGTTTIVKNGTCGVAYEWNLEP